MRRPGSGLTSQGQRPGGSQRQEGPATRRTQILLECKGPKDNGQRLPGQPSDTNHKPGTEDKLINESKESAKLINPNDLKPMVNLDSAQMKKRFYPGKKQ
ncbi:MAG: hypothetical protein IPK94_05375 [Saprospiraceae bacterium]|nr:hypothetical protein [Saprospiraceae bacterium]